MSKSASPALRRCPDPFAAPSCSLRGSEPVSGLHGRQHEARETVSRRQPGTVRGVASASRASTRPSRSWRSASTSTSSPASRAASLVTGPIETTRARSGKRTADRRDEVPHRRRRREGDVVGELRGLHRLRVGLLGDGLVQSDHVHLGPPFAKRVREHVPGLGGAGDEHRAVGRRRRLQRLHQRLGDRALGNDVGADPPRSQRAGGARPDRRHGRVGEGPASARRRRARRTGAARRSGSSSRPARRCGSPPPRRGPRPSRSAARSGSPGARSHRPRAPPESRRGRSPAPGPG